MADEIRHNPDEVANLSRQIGRHADDMESRAGEHTRETGRRLGRTRGRDPLANAVSDGSTRVLAVIKQAERELRQHLRDVQKGLDQTSRNHQENDKQLADMIRDIHNRSEAQDKKRQSWTDRVKGPTPGVKPVTVPVQWKSNMPKSQFAMKAQELLRLGRRGELYKATNPVERDKTITAKYKGALINLIMKNNKHDPALADEARRVAIAMNPDHVNELQTGGRDHWENIRMLDGPTNQEIGKRQIWPKIKNLADGTPIRIKVKWR